MNITPVSVDRDKARELYRAYKTHLHYSQPVDHEIMRAYQLLAQGRLVINATDAVARAGLDERGLPKLALCRATADACRCEVHTDGSAMMVDARLNGWRRSNEAQGHRFRWPRGTFAATRQHWRAEANLPLIPLHLRPARGLANYHILWEAEWDPIPPRDPYLLRRIGRSEMWLVVAMWNLTEVERLALVGRMNTTQ